MLAGAMLMWWILTVPSLLFVTIDIWRTTPESPVLKWAFVILTAFTGPLGAFFYVLGCREPVPGVHEAYVAARWRQVLGSTMHCVAGDGIGIIVGAAIGAQLALSFWSDFVLEYTLGFGFGWAFFQAFAMRDSAGGSYLTSLKMTFLPELLSMNLLMSGMVLTARFTMPHVQHSHDPLRPEFWFVMSMALIVGFVFAYPINWWLVANHMKHGMMTIRRRPVAGPMAGMADMTDMAEEHESMAGMEMAAGEQPSTGVKTAMTVATFVALGIALALVTMYA
ncbi:DUF4396 domain-containing protein [Mycobacterium sp. Y57]|uniref:DUF4396 domain-containing protein n=1 Tax=Mycolicibacterium xanthum TaxID=2796469 RepID=UPI001C85A8F7|nr:DUF4396 domain-containing protein [Mycolicibacterium xanthum]MBX7430532.1 DUF4396 domain-containing protein [Mycolicibacterium xanthum]